MEPVKTQFNNQEFDFAYPEGIERHYWNISRNYLLVRAIRKAGLQNESILEIGCGKGIVVAALRANQIACWGVELADIVPIQKAMPFVKPNTNAETLDTTFRNKISVLMILDVLEHIEDPINFLKEIMKSYPSVRHLIISVPGRQEIWSNYDEFYRHFRRYDLDQLDQTIRAIDYKIESNDYVFHSLYSVARFKFLFSKARPIKNIAPQGLFVFFHRMIAGFLISESIVLPSRLPGSSVFCIASKGF